MNKIPCASQNMEAKTLPADVCIFGHFRRLSSAAVHSADCRSEWWIQVSSIVTYLMKNSFSWRWNSCKQWSEWSTHFWSTVSKRSTNFEHMVNTLLSDIFNSSAISHNFNLRPAKMSLWSFLAFSRTTAEFGWPEHLASFVSVWLCLKSANHLLTIVSDGAESK